MSDSIEIVCDWIVTERSWLYSRMLYKDASVYSITKSYLVFSDMTLLHLASRYQLIIPWLTAELGQKVCFSLVCGLLGLQKNEEI